MKRRLVKVFIPCIIVITLVVITLFILKRVFLCQERIRAFLKSQIEDVLSRKVEMGDIWFDVFSRLTIDNFSIKEKDSTESIIEVEKITCDYDLWPLPTHRLLWIKEIRFLNPKVWLREKAGVWNIEDIFKDLVAKRFVMEGGFKKQGFPCFVSRVLIKNAEVVISGGDEILFRALNAEIRDLSLVNKTASTIWISSNKSPPGGNLHFIKGSKAFFPFEFEEGLFSFDLLVTALRDISLRGCLSLKGFSFKSSENFDLVISFDSRSSIADKALYIDRMAVKIPEETALLATGRIKIKEGGIEVTGCVSDAEISLFQISDILGIRKEEGRFFLEDAKVCGYIDFPEVTGKDPHMFKGKISMKNGALKVPNRGIFIEGLGAMMDVKTLCLNGRDDFQCGGVFSVRGISFRDYNIEEVCSRFDLNGRGTMREYDFSLRLNANEVTCDGIRILKPAESLSIQLDGQGDILSGDLEFDRIDLDLGHTNLWARGKVSHYGLDNIDISIRRLYVEIEDGISRFPEFQRIKKRAITELGSTVASGRLSGSLRDRIHFEVAATIGDIVLKEGRVFSLKCEADGSVRVLTGELKFDSMRINSDAGASSLFEGSVRKWGKEGIDFRLLHGCLNKEILSLWMGLNLPDNLRSFKEMKVCGRIFGAELSKLQVFCDVFVEGLKLQGIDNTVPLKVEFQGKGNLRDGDLCIVHAKVRGGDFLSGIISGKIKKWGRSECNLKFSEFLVVNKELFRLLPDKARRKVEDVDGIIRISGSFVKSQDNERRVEFNVKLQDIAFKYQNTRFKVDNIVGETRFDLTESPQVKGRFGLYGFEFGNFERFKDGKIFFELERRDKDLYVKSIHLLLPRRGLVGELQGEIFNIFDNKKGVVPDLSLELTFLSDICVDWPYGFQSAGSAKMKALIHKKADCSFISGNAVLRNLCLLFKEIKAKGISGEIPFEYFLEGAGEPEKEEDLSFLNPYEGEWKPNFRIEEIQYKDRRVCNLEADVTLSNGVVNVESFKLVLLDGTCLGNLIVDLRDGLAYQGTFNGTNVDLGRFLGRRYHKKEDREVSFDASFCGKGTEIEGVLNLTWIGDDVIGEVLDLIDPEGANPQICEIRKKIETYDYVKLRSVSVEAIGGFAYITIRLEAVGFHLLRLAKIEEIPIRRIPLKLLFERLRVFKKGVGS